MARTIAVIQKQILDAKAAEPELAALDSTSKRAIFLLWSYITASCIAIFEQLLDLYTANIETLVSRSPAATPAWIQAKMLQFQYDSGTPQIVQLIDTLPQYPVVDPTKRIIAACSVTSGVSNVVNVKVAKQGNPYTALDPALELPAAQSYINTIGMAGITYTVISKPADRLYVNADVYYQGQYSAIIKDNVVNALNAWLQQLYITNFDGSLKMSDLENTIRNVTGVSDVVLKNVRARVQSNIPQFTDGTDLILNTTILQRIYRSAAGYLVPEDLTGYALTDSLNFIAQ
jgi:hypothetical protein